MSHACPSIPRTCICGRPLQLGPFGLLKLSPPRLPVPVHDRPVGRACGRGLPLCSGNGQSLAGAHPPPMYPMWYDLCAVRTGAMAKWQAANCNSIDDEMIIIANCQPARQARPAPASWRIRPGCYTRLSNTHGRSAGGACHGHLWKPTASCRPPVDSASGARQAAQPLNPPALPAILELTLTFSRYAQGFPPQQRWRPQRAEKAEGGGGGLSVYVWRYAVHCRAQGTPGTREGAL